MRNERRAVNVSCATWRCLLCVLKLTGNRLCEPRHVILWSRCEVEAPANRSEATICCLSIDADLFVPWTSDQMWEFQSLSSSRDGLSRTRRIWVLTVDFQATVLLMCPGSCFLCTIEIQSHAFNTTQHRLSSCLFVLLGSQQDLCVRGVHTLGRVEIFSDKPLPLPPPRACFA